MAAGLGATACTSDQFSPNDAGTDAPVAVGDGGGDAADASVVPTTYSDIGSAASWSVFDLSTLNPTAGGCVGATFDGRYAYFAPGFNTVALRHDTTQDLGTAAAWDTFDLSNASPGSPVGYTGAAFDGRYVYFAPNTSIAFNIPSGVAARFDTQASFAAASSWTFFDLTTLTTSARGFAGVVFDGRYLYYVPLANGGTNATFARFDTKASFSASASWQTVDVSTLNAGASGFTGGVFDGRYLYAAPFTGTRVVRYDTQAPFQTGWAFFDPTVVDPDAKAFTGIAFDGRYLYLVPNRNSTGTTARYDTQGPFSTAASWATFKISTVDAKAVGFLGGAFDGRYVYYAPFANPNVTDAGTSLDGLLARYDTQASFASAASWSTFDLTTLDPGAIGFMSSLFDGRHLYLAGFTNRIVRFDAKSPASMPSLPAFHGSFF